MISLKDTEPARHVCCCHLRVSGL